MTPIIERVNGLELLRKAANKASAGSGRIMLISGESGIGKTWLVDQFLGELASDRLHARATCDNLSSTRSFGPLFDMAEHLGEPFLNDLTVAITGPDPLGSAGHMLLHLQPGAVLVFEDIHNADGQTIDLLKYLFRRIGEARFLLIASYQPEALGQEHRLAELLAECPAMHTEQFQMPPLTRTEAAAMFGTQPERIEANFRVSGGNPLILSILQRKDYKDGDDVPEAIKRIAAANLQRQSPAQRIWTELLAAVPPPHSPDLPGLLSRQFELDPRMIDTSGAILTRGSNPGFRNEIMRKAVLASMPDFARLDLQRKLMTMMQTSVDVLIEPESLFRLALETGDSPAVTAMAIPAAKAAESRGDLNDCVAHLTNALPHSFAIDPINHAQISELWACRTAVLEGISDRTLTLIARNIEHWKRLELHEAYGASNLLLGRLLFYRGERAAAGTYIDQAIATFESIASSVNLVMALALAAEVAIGEGSIAQARQLASRIEAAGEFCNDISASLELTLIRTRLLKIEGKSGEIWGDLDAAFEAAESNALHDLAARIQIAACDIALGDLDLNAADRWADRMSGHTASPMMNCWKTAVLGRKAMIALHRGQTDQAKELASAALSEISPPAAFAFVARFANAVIAVRSADPDACTALTDCQHLTEIIGDLDCKIAVQLAWIEFHYLSGRVEPAKLAYAAALEALSKPSPSHPANALLDLWEFRLGGDRSDADAPRPLPIALEMAGEPEAAAKAWLDLGHAYFAALSRISAQGDGLLARLTQSVDEFAAMQATAALGLIQLTADKFDIVLPNRVRKRGPYRAARSNPFGLTRREVEILQMIVNGDSNRDIADRLSRSLRTIEHHVSAILGKLQIESRVQAALFAISHRDILDG